MTASLVVKYSSQEPLEFHGEYLVFKGEKIPYKDFDGLAYLYTRTNHSVYFVPVGTSHSYNIKFRAAGKKYEINFSSKDGYDSFVKICAGFEASVKKYVLINLLIEFADKGGISIADLNINSQGIFKKKLFGSELLLWSEFYNCINLKGTTFLFKKAGNKNGYKQFYSCSMSVMNAPLLSEVLSFINQFKGIISKADLVKIKEERAEKDHPSPVIEQKTCPSCGEIVKNEKQKFCAKCGTALTSH